MPRPVDAGAALPRLTGRMARWAAALAATAWLVEGVTAVGAPRPALVAGLVVGATAATRVRDLPLHALAAFAGAVAADLGGMPTLPCVAAGVGTSVTFRAPHPRSPLDLLLGALAATAAVGLALALAASSSLLAEGGSAVRTGLVALLAPFAMLPAAWRHDHPEVPGRRALAGLRGERQATAARALALAREALPLCSDAPTRRRLLEVALWVVRLQQSRGRLDDEAARLHPTALAQRLGPLPASPALTRLAAHRQWASAEAGRCGSLAHEALTWLEDARACLVLGRLTGTTTRPPEVGELLERLRMETRDLRARTHASWEVG
ncbi:MAG: hypothetical protein H6732_00465 [Alphaproteobacteria bacterium]|nr:hypothetical protein [Alphaproteobacteria bacterium]